MSNISKQQVLDAFHFRSACRYYDPNKKISREDMDYILDVAKSSNSRKNQTILLGNQTSDG